MNINPKEGDRGSGGRGREGVEGEGERELERGREEGRLGRGWDEEELTSPRMVMVAVEPTSGGLRVN